VDSPLLQRGTGTKGVIPNAWDSLEREATKSERTTVFDCKKVKQQRPKWAGRQRPSTCVWWL